MSTQAKTTQLLKITCAGCGNVLTVVRAQNNKGAIEGKCSKCGNQILVRTACPSCRVDVQADSTECEKCGIIFDKYEKNQRLKLKREIEVTREQEIASENISKRESLKNQDDQDDQDEEKSDNFAESTTQKNNLFQRRSLRKCKDCGHDISISAKRCPNCGAVPVNIDGCLGCASILFIVVIMVSIHHIIQHINDNGIVYWLISWVVFAVLISFKTKSKMSIFGGGFIASLLLVIIFTITIGKGKVKENTQQTTINKVEKAVKVKEITRQQKSINKVKEEVKLKRRRAERAAQRELEEEQCKKNLQCWGDKQLLSASIHCDGMVERFAKYDHEWTDGWLGAKFSRFLWKNEPKLIMTYIGDKIKFQNGFGAWQHMIYSCDYDTINEKVIDVRVSPGRL